MKYVLGVLVALAVLAFAGVSTVFATHDGTPDCIALAAAEEKLAGWGAKVEAEKEGKYIYRLPNGRWLKVTKDKEQACIVEQGEGEAPKL